MKKLITIVVLIALGFGIYSFYQNQDIEIDDLVIDENDDFSFDFDNGQDDDFDNQTNDEFDVIEPVEFEEGEVAQNDYLVVESPIVGDVIESPLEMSGQVRGNWLFEANAPVVLTDWNGLIIAEGFIQTDESWMTTDFVSFTGTLEFETPEDIGEFSNRGYIIFHKANMSDKAELDDALEFMVRYR